MSISNRSSSFIIPSPGAKVQADSGVLAKKQFAPSNMEKKHGMLPSNMGISWDLTTKQGVEWVRHDPKIK